MSSKHIHLKEIALQLFANDGFQTVTVSKIAEYAKISKGSVYCYYPCKDMLIRVIVLEGIEHFELFLNEHKRKCTTSNRILFFANTILEVIEENLLYTKLYFKVILHKSDTKSLLSRRFRGILIPYVKDLILFFRTRGYPDPVAEVRTLFLVLLGTAFRYQLSPKEFPLRKIKDKLNIVYS